jgi:hypothetical protein
MRKLRLNPTQLDDLTEVLTEAAHQTIRAAPEPGLDGEEYLSEWVSPGEKWFELFLQSVEQQVIEDE